MQQHNAAASFTFNVSLNQAAFVTTMVPSAVCIVSAIGVATTASTVTAVFLGILAVGSGAVSAGAITAWIKSEDNTSAGQYFRDVKKHSAYIFVGFAHIAVQTIIQALIQGLAEGVGISVRRKIAGPDITARIS